MRSNFDERTRSLYVQQLAQVGTSISQQQRELAWNFLSTTHPLHPDPYAPPKILSLTRHRQAIRHLHQTRTNGERDVPERRDVEGEHGGDGGGPGGSSKAQLRRGSGRHGA